jgi:predicted RNA polymerase sigma factor
VVREELRDEAIRLARRLVELLSGEPEAVGLLALLRLIHPRRAARIAARGSLVLLAEQDRTRWDRPLIAEGQGLVRACLPTPSNAASSRPAGSPWTPDERSRSSNLATAASSCCTPRG